MLLGELEMGMDLIGAGLSYNWAGWHWLVNRLLYWGVDVRELTFHNDGDLISKETCVAVADALEAHLHELDEEERIWIEPHIEQWRNCNGCSQW
jgi:hypothetical protein